MDIATLSIAVDSRQVKDADRAMGSMADTGSKLAGIIGKIAAASGLLMMAKQLFDTNAEFQRLHASLITVTGSAAQAEQAFGMLRTLAQNTPYELTEVTQAFIDLKTRGMDASASSLVSYGDMASSFGRSLTDTIRAISGVAMGETEAIKSFGVQAAAQGDRIALTFKGQTTLVKRTMGDVEAYFKMLSQANFGGGMERQMQTLGGLMSNLKDQIAATLFAIGNAGVSGAMGSGIRSLTAAIAQATPAIISFTASLASGMAKTIQTTSKFKAEILGLLTIPLAFWINSSVAALAAFIAPALRAITLTTALSIQAGGFGIAATAAAAATGLWNGALALLGSTAGMLAIGLAALYFAMRPVMQETERLNEATRQSEERYTRLVDPIMKAKDRTRELREENERLQKVLAGDKGVKILGGESQSLVNQIKREGGDVEWAQIQARKLDVEITTNQKLKEQLENRNRLLQEAANEQKRITEARKGFIKSLQEEVDLQGLSGVALSMAKAEAIGLNTAEGSIVHTLLMKKAAYNSALLASNAAADAAKTRMDAENAALNGARDAVASLRDEWNPLLAQEREYQTLLSQINLLEKQGEMTAAAAIQARQAAWMKATGTLENVRALQRQYESPDAAYSREKTALDNAKPYLAADVYARALQDLDLRHLKLKADAGSTWAIIGYTVTQEAGQATDALTSWVNGTDGLGRSWQTLGDTVKQVLHDMVVDMEKAIIKQQLMQPLMNGLGAAIGTVGDGKGWASFASAFGAAWGGKHADGGSVTGGTVNLVGERGPELFVPSTSGTVIPNHALGGQQQVNNISINVSVSESGKVDSSAKSSASQGNAIAKSLKSSMDAWAIDQMRPGGLLAGRA